MLPPLSPLYIFKLSLCPSKIRYFHNIYCSTYIKLYPNFLLKQNFLSPLDISFSDFYHRGSISYASLSTNVVLTKFSNTEIRIKLQTLSFMYDDNLREMNVLVLVIIVNRRPGIYRSLNARPSGLRLLVKCQTVRQGVYPGGGGYGRPWMTDTLLSFIHVFYSYSHNLSHHSYLHKIKIKQRNPPFFTLEPNSLAQKKRTPYNSNKLSFFRTAGHRPAICCVPAEGSLSNDDSNNRTKQ